MSSTLEIVPIGEAFLETPSDRIGMKRCVDVTGSDGVESNMLFRVFRSQASQNCVQATFRDHRKGSGDAGNWIVGQRRGDAHDAAAGLLCLHLLNRKLRDVNEACEIGRDERAKVVCGILRERLHHEDAGVRNDSVDRAELLDREFCNFLRGLKLTYVAIDKASRSEAESSFDFVAFRAVPTTL